MEGKGAYISRTQDSLEVHLLEEGKGGQLGAALVLVQGGQHAGPLRSRSPQDAARDGLSQGLLQLLLPDLAPSQAPIRPWVPLSFASQHCARVSESVSNMCA